MLGILIVLIIYKIKQDLKKIIIKFNLKLDIMAKKLYQSYFVFYKIIKNVN